MKLRRESAVASLWKKWVSNWLHNTNQVKYGKTLKIKKIKNLIVEIILYSFISFASLPIAFVSILDT